MDPSRPDLRAPFGAVLAIACALIASDAFAQTPITLFRNFVGNVNYEATGGSLRAAPNTTNACALNPTSTASVTGIPATASPRAAFLYWAGSGTAPDATVTLNGLTVTADRVFTDTFSTGGTDYDFFAGFADVTAIVAGNGTQTFGNLSVDNGAPFCQVQAVVAGWGLIVVYEDAGEDLRAVNVFDGFELFRSSALTLTVDTFRIPPAPVNGKVTHVTFEGDPQNSGTLGGFGESLSFNGAALDDGIVPPGSSPAIQQFDGTVNTLGVGDSHGVDVDTYDVSALLNPGDTSASTTYSAGQDLVLLAAEVISFTTEPVVDLTLSKTHAGDFTVGATGSYVLEVGNLGPEPEANPVTITDTLPAGLTFAGASGTGWTCVSTAPVVDCTHLGPVPVGGSAPPLTLNVTVGPAAAPAVTNSATVTSASADANTTNNAANDPTVVRASDLSTSTKTVVDMNGGEAEPGDVLRYTVSLVESGGIGAAGVRVTDDLPALTMGFTIVSSPPGSTDSSTGTGSGANGTGRLDIGDIAIPAGGTATIVFDVTIAPAAAPGDVIANVASIANPAGSGATAVAPNVIVSPSQIPTGGTKQLYLLDLATADPNGFDEGPRPYLSRTPPAGGQNDVTVSKNQPPRVWTLTPALQAPLTIDAGTIPVTLNLARDGGGFFPATRRLEVALAGIGASSGPIGAPVTQTFAAPVRFFPTTLTFNIPVAAPVTLQAGTQITLTLTNTTPGFGSQSLLLFPTVGASRSVIELPALTVIRVDAAATYDDAYPGGSPASVFAPGDSVALRATVSDPFGAFDIATVTLDIIDASGTTVVSGQPMSRVAQPDGATGEYEWLLSVPAAAAAGRWRYRVTAVEGTEGTVTHTRDGTFDVGSTQLMLTKSVTTLSDPVNGTTNAKAIPNATVLYTLTVANVGSLATDPDTVEIVDRLPPATALYVDASSGDPIAFVDGSPTSGLGYDFAAHVAFSNRPGGSAPFDYVPTPDAAGFDPAVTSFRIRPGGAFAATGSSPPPQFTLRYRVRVD